MIAGIATIVLSAIFSSLLIPASMILLASYGLFPPISIRIGERKMVFRGRPIATQTAVRSVTSSPAEVTTYTLGQSSSMTATYAAVATFTLFMHTNAAPQLGRLDNCSNADTEYHQLTG